MTQNIICFLNQKGGVGKTTIAHNTAYILATKFNKKILLLDLDQQGNSSEIYLRDKNVEPCIGEIFKNKFVNIDNLISKAKLINRDGYIDNLDIIHSNISLSKALKEIPLRSYKEKILSKALKNIRDNYNYIIIDCPASIEDSVINAIYLANNFIIPVEIGGFASSAIQDVIELIAEIKEFDSMQKLLDSNILKFIKNKVDGRAIVLNKLIDNEIKTILPYSFKHYIRQSLYISRATINKLPIIEYKDMPNVVINDYIQYIEELIKYCNNQNKK